MNQVKPFGPADARANVVNVIPDTVLNAVNALLSENYDASEITLTQKDIIARVKKLRHPADDFDYKWLNFEPVYEQAGWVVKYEKPAYDENFDAYFTFKPKNTTNY